MALYVTFKSGRQREFWVQDLEEAPVRAAILGMASGVDSVQADGHELEMIRSKFTGLPDTNKRVVRWFGDHARFIVGNL